MTRLLLRADDAGCTRGSNEAILACVRNGLIRNVGFMACTPAFDHAAELFRDAPSDVALGLHATVTSEWTTSLRWGPVLPKDQVPSLLAADGNFFDSTLTLHEQADHDQIIAEVCAQISKARAAGLHLTYLDTHMGFDWFPGLQDRLDTLAEAEGLVIDRHSDGMVSSLPASPLDTFLTRATQLDPDTTHRAVFHPSTLDSDALLMVGVDVGDPSAVARQRAAETALLSDSTTAAKLSASNVELITYADL